MDIPTERLKEMLRVMYTIRAFECKARELYEQSRIAGNFLGALHSYEGEEAVATGVCSALRQDDYVLSTHRGHGHAIAKGAGAGPMMAELVGKETGISRGRGGSMHMYDPGIGLLGGNGIVGGGIPLALGPAFSAQYRGSDQVTVGFFGDGGACQGGFHESLNLAAVWKLPVVYVCENNQYAVTTPIGQSLACQVATRADGYGCPGRCVDGMDVLAVYEAAVEAVERARAGEGPTLIECHTYRYQAHCMVIPDRRDADELAKWQALDPILRFEKHLLEGSAMDEAEQEQLRAQAAQAMEEAVAFVDESEFPDPATAAHYVWA